ncbi:MAG: hypothetical protein IPH78_14700 [Bacteroidetes bacterium]|nr:hypothetical protein [Bacteroidota bacterium]
MNKSLIVISFFIAGLCSAQSSLPIKKLTIFKNGTAMMVKEGNASTSGGNVILPIPEQTLFGTYFTGTGKDNAVKNIVFRNDTLKKKDLCRSIWQYLAGNINKSVTISYTPTQGIDKTVSGKIASYDLYSGMLKLNTESNKTLIIHVDKIYQADFKEEPVSFYMADSIKRVLVLKPEKPIESLSLQEIYMTKGFNWLPHYFLKLKDEKNGRLEMKATVENYAEELKDAELELVVGSPQMSYSQVMDPMTYDYITNTVPDNNDYRSRSGYMQANAVAMKSMEADAGYFSSSFTTEGEKNGDMYIYKIGKVTLPNQSKGVFPIVAGNVEYKDKYEGTISDFTNFYSSRYVPAEDKSFDIYHSLELKNTSSVPFTTASVMVINEKDQFVAQDELKYTPVGASSNIRLSKAIDIVMKNNEEEKNREDNAKKTGKVVYHKVTIKGAVSLENFQNKDVTVSITKNVFGTITKAEDGGKITINKSYSYVNPSSDVKWEVKLAANQKKNINYEYEVFFTP